MYKLTVILKGFDSKLRIDDIFQLVVLLSAIPMLMVMSAANLTFVRSLNLPLQKIEKLKSDMLLVSENYSISEASLYVEFFLNSGILTTVVFLATVLIRFLFWWNVPYSHHGRHSDGRVLISFVVAMTFLIYWNWVQPSPFKALGEHSLVKFGPGIKATVITYFFHAAFAMFAYGGVVHLVTVVRTRFART